MRMQSLIGKGGRIVIPADFREALNLEVGDKLILELEKTQIRMIPLDQAVRLAQEKVRPYLPKGRSLSKELIAERRREAKRE